MAVKVEVNLGFIKFSWEVETSDRERENWINFLSSIRDYRVLTGALSYEYAGEVFDSVARLRNDVLRTAIAGLPVDAGLRVSYEAMLRATRDFMVAIRNIGRETLTNRDLRLADIRPIGNQWTFAAALVDLRRSIVRQIEENCQVFGVEVPDEFKLNYILPDAIAEQWADELAPISR